ncbi:hypothetical protein ACFQ51_46560 [Streptomyces kaempferi]
MTDPLRPLAPQPQKEPFTALMICGGRHSSIKAPRVMPLVTRVQLDEQTPSIRASRATCC